MLAGKGGYHELERVVAILEGDDFFLRQLALRLPEEKQKSLKDSGARPRRPNAGLLARAFEVTPEILDSAHARFKNRLSSLIETWLASEGDAKRWTEENPALWKGITEDVENKMWAEAIATPNGIQIVTRFDEVGGVSLADAEAAAGRLFLSFARNPMLDRFRRCPREKCRRYFVAGRSDASYCSQRCASADSAKKALSNRRGRERSAKLVVARRLIRRWITARRPGDWKTWIVAKSEGRLKRRFLTVAVKAADLRVPGVSKKKPKR